MRTENIGTDLLELMRSDGFPQGLEDRALWSYERLSLRYPSVSFVDLYDLVVSQVRGEEILQTFSQLQSEVKR